MFVAGFFCFILPTLSWKWVRKWETNYCNSWMCRRWAALHWTKLVNWQYVSLLLGGNAPFKIIPFPFRVLCVLCVYQLHCVYSQNNLYETINFQYIYAFFTCAHTTRFFISRFIQQLLSSLRSVSGYCYRWCWMLLYYFFSCCSLLCLLLLLLPFSFSFNKTLFILCANKYINMVGIPWRALFLLFLTLHC